MSEPTQLIVDNIGVFFGGGSRFDDFPVVVTPASDIRYGDLTTNIAMSSFTKLKGEYASPRALAEKIVESLNSHGEIQDVFSKIEVAGGGFINFWYSEKFLLNTVLDFSHGKVFSGVGAYHGMKVMTEFTDPNPFKEFHIGHLYSNIVGESISRILEANGAEVRRVCYQGDIGLHVAKALWGVEKKLDGKDISSLSSEPLEVRVKFLGQAYALGATAFEEDEGAKVEIIEINKRVFAKEEKIMALYEVGKTWSLEYFDTIYDRLGTKFWKFYFESEVGERGKALVEEYLEKGVFEESEGAVIFNGERYGLHNRVFINSLGLPTYEAKELGLAPAKYEDYKFDLSVMVTGNEIDEYFRVLLKALSFIYPEIAERTKHISHGMVRLPSGKMSSRTGNVITGESLLDEADQKAEARIEEVREGKKISGDTHKIARVIGDGAVKYALLKNNVGGDVVFNFDDVVNFEGNSGPYLQYTYVRIRGILEKAGKSVAMSDLKAQGLELEEEELLRYLLLYPYVLGQAAIHFAPSGIATYLYDLSQRFNTFYQKHKVVGGVNEEFRLVLVAAVGNVLKNGLNLLGIETVEKM